MKFQNGRRPARAVLAAVVVATAVATSSAPASADAPDTRISGPWVTSSATPDYALASPSADVSRFECSVNYGAWVSCTSPYRPALTKGNNSVRARAFSSDGLPDASPAISWTYLDQQSPVVSFADSNVSLTADGLLHVQASATDDYVLRTLAIDVDGARVQTQDLGYSAKQGAVTWTSLGAVAKGPHQVVVVAADAAGNQTSKTASITIGTPTPPDTAISGPWVSASSTPSYALSSPSPDIARFECSVNSGPWVSCTSSFTPKLSSASNSVRARAVSTAGLADPSPATSWTYVDQRSPVISFGDGNVSLTSDGLVHVEASATDEYVLHNMTIDVDDARVLNKDLGYSSKQGAVTWTSTAGAIRPGEHQVVVSATDAAGNRTSRTASITVPGDPVNDGSAESGWFSMASFWNAGTIASAPLDPAGGPVSSALLAEVQREIAAGSGPWISTTSYSTPVYRVAANQARVAVQIDSGSWADSLRSALASGVPIPADAAPAKGLDGHMTIYQQSTDTLWEFWQMSKQTDGWHAAWGGVMPRVSTNPGYFVDLTQAGTGTVLSQANWGATASSLPLVGGLITIDEVRRGSIPHALALGVPHTCAGRWSWPAQRTDGISTAPDCLPEGARLRLDPTLDLSQRPMPPLTRMLAQAAQKYGIVVRDMTASAVGFYAEDDTPFGGTVWSGTTGRDGLLAGNPWELVRNQFPWDGIQLVSPDAR